MAPSSPISSARVLCVCADPLLRATRQLVFSLRFVTVSVAFAAEMLLLANEAFDAVVLCHTLTMWEREAAVQIALKQWAHAEIIVLARMEGSAVPNGGKVISTVDGPDFLLDCVGHLLQSHSRKQISRGWPPASQGFYRAAGTA